MATTARLAGRVAVVTGAGSGIGLAAVRRLAAEGARVVCVDTVAESGRSAAWEADGEFVECDVADESAVRELFDGVAARHGRIDIAVNSAGLAPPPDSSIMTTGPATRDRVVNVDPTGVQLCCRYAIPHMLRQGRGAIVNTASMVALTDSATARGAEPTGRDEVLALTRDLGVEYARRGIRVNAVCAGPVATPGLAALSAATAGLAALSAAAPEPAARWLANVPMGRYAEPSEIAAAIAFLASDDASFMTGTHVVVDGGITGAHGTPP